MIHDPYDSRIAFDDLYEAEAVHSPRIDLACILGEVVRGVRANRFASPPVHFEVLGAYEFNAYQQPDPHKFELIGSTPFSIEQYVQPDPKHYSIIGGEENLKRNGLHIFADYYRKFKNALPTTKIVAVEKRLSALEAAFREYKDMFDLHTADGHGPHVIGAEMIPLHHRRDALCWQQGKNVFCSVKGADGYLTSCAPILPAAEEVVGMACVLGLDGNDIAESVPHFYSAAQVLTGDRLANELCAVRPFARKVGCVGAIRSKADPAICAAMSLIQRCQKGDRTACEELSRLATVCGTLVEDAAKRLHDGQKAKRRRSWS